MAGTVRPVNGGAMEPHTGRSAIGHDELLVHNWRVWQLTRLGIPGRPAGQSGLRGSDRRKPRGQVPAQGGAVGSGNPPDPRQG